MDMDLSNASNARTKAGEVDSINERRKQITSQIEDEIEQLIEHEVDAENDRVIIIKGENWNSGVIGIDTDRLKERFLRPAIIFSSTTSSDFLRASVRSIPTIDMYSIIDEIGEPDEDDNIGADARSKADAPEIDATVYLRDIKDLNEGDIINVQIEDAAEGDLFGVPI